jgi:hypothetical protein
MTGFSPNNNFNLSKSMVFGGNNEVEILENKVKLIEMK